MRQNRTIVRVMSRLLLCILLFSFFSVSLISCKDKTYESIYVDDSNYAEFMMNDGRRFIVELDPEAAPITVANFKRLVADHFYDGLTFHRVIEGFMIQGGDPLGNGTGGSQNTIKGEFSANGYNNPIRHEKGVISMARSNNYNSASSQFFICTATASHLDGQYAAFGRVIYGMETVMAIEKVETDSRDKPKTPVAMKQVRFVSQETVDQVLGKK